MTYLYHPLAITVREEVSKGVLAFAREGGQEICQALHTQAELSCRAPTTAAHPTTAA